MNNAYGNLTNPSQSPLISGERYPYNLDQVNLWDYFRNTIESIAQVARKARLRLDRGGLLTKIKCGRLLVCNARPEKITLRTLEREVRRILRAESRNRIDILILKTDCSTDFSTRLLSAVARLIEIKLISAVAIDLCGTTEGYFFSPRLVELHHTLFNKEHFVQDFKDYQARYPLIVNYYHGTSDETVPHSINSFT